MHSTFPMAKKSCFSWSIQSTPNILSKRHLAEKEKNVIKYQRSRQKNGTSRLGSRTKLKTDLLSILQKVKESYNGHVHLMIFDAHDHIQWGQNGFCLTQVTYILRWFSLWLNASRLVTESDSDQSEKSRWSFLNEMADEPRSAMRKVASLRLLQYTLGWTTISHYNCKLKPHYILPRDEAPNKQILRQTTRANLIQALKLRNTMFTQDVLNGIWGCYKIRLLSD